MKNIIYLLIVTSFFTSCLGLEGECKLGDYDRARDGFYLFPSNKLNLADRIDTEFTNSNYKIYSVSYDCFGDYDGFKLLQKLKPDIDSLYQPPAHWQIVDDSIMYVNRRFLNSSINWGLVVSVTSKGSHTHYEYPKSIISDSLRNYLNNRGTGLYELKDSSWIKITDWQSNDEFEKKCRNGTYFIPYPGWLYDKKVNLNELDTWPW